MISIDEIRSALISAIYTVHTSNYPDIDINFPNRFTTDLEHYNKDFFVTVELYLGNSIEFSTIVNDDFDIEGKIKITAVAKTNTGTKKLTDYVDTVVSDLVSTGVSGISFNKMSILSISPYPGYYGEMLYITFRCIK